MHLVPCIARLPQGDRNSMTLAPSLAPPVHRCVTWTYLERPAQRRARGCRWQSSWTGPRAWQRRHGRSRLRCARATPSTTASWRSSAAARRCARPPRRSPCTRHAPAQTVMLRPGNVGGWARLFAVTTGLGMDASGQCVARALAVQHGCSVDHGSALLALAHSPVD